MNKKLTIYINYVLKPKEKGKEEEEDFKTLLKKLKRKTKLYMKPI
jgi:hypothetical protein